VLGWTARRHKKKHKKKSKDHDREDEGLKRLRDAGSGEKAEEKPAESKEEAAAEKMGLELGLTPAQIAFERNRQRRVCTPASWCCSLVLWPCAFACECCWSRVLPLACVVLQLKDTLKDQVQLSYRDKIEVRQPMPWQTPHA